MTLKFLPGITEFRCRLPAGMPIIQELNWSRMPIRADSFNPLSIAAFVLETIHLLTGYFFEHFAQVGAPVVGLMAKQSAGCGFVQDAEAGAGGRQWVICGGDRFDRDLFLQQTAGQCFFLDGHGKIVPAGHTGV